MDDNQKSGRRKDDFYVTPFEVVEAILPHVLDPRMTSVCDPACGDGAILSVLAALYPELRLQGIELDQSRRAKTVELLGMPNNQLACADALSCDCDLWWDADLIITNPPFSLAQEFVERALATRRMFAMEGLSRLAHGLAQTSEPKTMPTVAMLLRLAFLESAKRAAFHRRYPADVYVLSSRPSFTGDGKSDSCAYAWFVWGKGKGGSWTVLDWKPQRQLSALRSEPREAT